VPHRAIGPLDS